MDEDQRIKAANGLTKFFLTIGDFLFGYGLSTLGEFRSNGKK
jgi:hypothetical protein